LFLFFAWTSRKNILGLKKAKRKDPTNEEKAIISNKRRQIFAEY